MPKGRTEQKGDSFTRTGRAGISSPTRWVAFSRRFSHLCPGRSQLVLGRRFDEGGQTARRDGVITKMHNNESEPSKTPPEETPDQHGVPSPDDPPPTPGAPPKPVGDH
jgi:hypothetical protein